MRMNIVWTLATATSLFVLAITNPNAVVSVCVESGSKALRYAAELTAVYCLWMGVFNIAEQCRFVQGLAKAFRSVLKFLFGELDDETNNYISLNMASNLLGVGNAATPSAIEALKRTEKSQVLSRAGTMLFVVNASGIQLIPTTVIGLRAQLGSVNASDILLPTLLSTVVTSVVGVVLVFVAYGRTSKSSSVTNRAKKVVLSNSIDG